MSDVDFSGGPLPDGWADIILERLETSYVESLNAVLASRDVNNPDVDRWRGHAEAYRQVAVFVREITGVRPVDMTSEEWRKANGVYQPDCVTEWVQEARAGRSADKQGGHTEPPQPSGRGGLSREMWELLAEGYDR